MQEKAAKKYCEPDTNAYNIIKNTKEDDYKFYLAKGMYIFAMKVMS